MGFIFICSPDDFKNRVFSTLFPRLNIYAAENLQSNDLITEENNVAGFNSSGKLTTDKALDIAKIDPKGYQELVKKGLIENPIEVNNEIKHFGGGGPTPTPGQRTILTPPNINSCGDILSPGSYVLKQDISSSGICINIHDISNVNLDCQGHTITYLYYSGDYPSGSLNISNVQNFSVKNCKFISTNPSQIQQNLIITNSNQGILKNNQIVSGYIDVSNSNNLDISYNNFNSIYQQNNSSSNQIHDNMFTASSNSSSPAVIISNFGNHNVIKNNSINGSWDNKFTEVQNGADDGIVIAQESDDEITENFISNNWDCGIESTDFIQNTKISNNRIYNSGFCGIGAWYWNSWLGNTVDSNFIDGASYMFYFYRIFGLNTATNEQTVYFKDNIFSNNIFLHQKITSGYSGVIDFQNLPGEINASNLSISNNSFKNNDFGQAAESPVLIPGTMFVDLGNNKCAPSIDPNYPLKCTPEPIPPLNAKIVGSTTLTVGTSYNYNIQANDSAGTLQYADVIYTKSDYTLPPYCPEVINSGPWCYAVKHKSITGTQANIVASVLPKISGTYFLAVNLYDIAGVKCTGNPQLASKIVPGWKWCGPLSSLFLYIFD